jgi:enterochelin esterase-like enzyme
MDLASLGLRASASVGATGFEPATSCSQSKRASRAAPRPENGTSIMRRMKTRQAILFFAFFATVPVLSACSSANDVPLTQTITLPPPTPTITATLTPSPVPPTATSTPLACLLEAGEIRQEVVPDSKPPQEFLIYLPPCYAQQTTQQYPVLYLLHGQTYTQDQWVRLGVPSLVDQLIHSGESLPFIVVFPDDHYWNAPAGASFGNRLVNNIIPQVDASYRTLTDRKYRALGGLSRGGGWTVKLGFEHPELFGALGLHSPAIFKDNAPFIESYIQNIPESARPRLWFDIGDADRELGSAQLLEQILTRNDYLHEFHLFSGDHTENYWSTHAGAYLRWYALGWQEAQEP